MEEKSQPKRERNFLVQVRKLAKLTLETYLQTRSAHIIRPRWSSGYDSALSQPRAGFDSPSGKHNSIFLGVGSLPPSSLSFFSFVFTALLLHSHFSLYDIFSARLNYSDSLRPVLDHTRLLDFASFNSSSDCEKDERTPPRRRTERFHQWKSRSPLCRPDRSSSPSSPLLPVRSRRRISSEFLWTPSASGKGQSTDSSSLGLPPTEPRRVREL